MEKDKHFYDFLLFLCGEDISVDMFTINNNCTRLCLRVHGSVFYMDGRL